jgi:omega-hydroxy-beta-dihydromenaquinone-9 sulfotransferase
MNKIIAKAFSNLMLGIRFTTLFKMAFVNGISLYPKYILRFLSLVPNSIIVEIFIIVERVKYGRKIKRTIIEKPPVFIIGHWRSGTTFLHQLISLDNQFTAPTVVQTLSPEHFLSSSKYWVPVMNLLMPKKRPMDEVEIKPFAPMEDEWALIRMGSDTPFLKVFFPSSKTKFLSDIHEFIPKGKDLVKWERNLMTLLKKITFLTHKQIVLKNPFHTPRMLLLAEMFPGARFIHIVRHPYKIVPSAINTWNIVSGENAFKKGWKNPTIDETAAIVNNFWNSVNENKMKLKENEFAEVRYEDLESDPVMELKEIYKQLDLQFSEQFEASIIRFLEEKKDYKKNFFNLSPADKDIIFNRLSPYFKAYSYD